MPPPPLTLLVTLNVQLEFGANVSHKNMLGEDVWSFAVANDNDLILRLLVVHQSSVGLDTEDGECSTVWFFLVLL